jgi:cytochrome P450
MLEATIALAALLQRFRISSELPDVPPDTQGMTLRPSGPVPIHMVAR